jgi:hypothetical protein
MPQLWKAKEITMPNEPKIKTAEERDKLGEVVREVWIQWAREQPTIKESWVVPYYQLSEPSKEVDRRIGETLFSAGEAQGISKGREEKASELATLQKQRDMMISMLQGHAFTDDELKQSGLGIGVNIELRHDIFKLKAKVSELEKDKENLKTALDEGTQ